jgi:hypothetical protein
MATMFVPVLRSMKLPVPYVFFAFARCEANLSDRRSLLVAEVSTQRHFPLERTARLRHAIES